MTHRLAEKQISMSLIPTASCGEIKIIIRGRTLLAEEIRLPHRVHKERLIN